MLYLKLMDSKHPEYDQLLGPFPVLVMEDTLLSTEDGTTVIFRGKTDRGGVQWILTGTFNGGREGVGWPDFAILPAFVPNTNLDVRYP